MDKIMFNEYIDKAMQHAQCEQIEDGTYFCRIPGFQGVWANKPTEQESREELREVWKAGYYSTLLITPPCPESMG